MTSRLRTAGPAAATGIVIVLAAAGCGATVAPHPAEPPSPPVSPVSEQGAVPWVDKPGQFFKPSPLPAHYRPANAPACTAAQVRVSPQGTNGAAGHLFWYFTFRNVSGTTCILRGYPLAVASEPGKPNVTATHSDWFRKEERSGNMRPGGVTMLSIETDYNCRARYAHPNEQPKVYHTVTVSLPGGGQVVVNGALDVLCGLSTGRFAVRQPPQRYTHSPVAGARVALDLPRGAAAGTTLDYVAALANPTGTGMVLTPCPGYQQEIGPAGKAALLSLNCRAQRSIPAHQTVRFAMRLHVPAGTPTGPHDLYWRIAGPGGAFAHGSLHVYGRDTPCRPAQLHASVAGPGRIPGPPNIMGIKGMATAVPLAVTNISGRACSVYGVPTVAVRAADGTDLGLRQIPIQNYSLQPVPQPQTAITLAPHTGTARTTLYWYLPWCGPDPNPVTVTITLPANNATITVTPAGGWNPPPCHRAPPGPHRTPGLVSASPFRPA